MVAYGNSILELSYNKGIREVDFGKLKIDVSKEKLKFGIYTFTTISKIN